MEFKNFMWISFFVAARFIARGAERWDTHAQVGHAQPRSAINRATTPIRMPYYYVKLHYRAHGWQGNLPFRDGYQKQVAQRAIPALPRQTPRTFVSESPG